MDIINEKKLKEATDAGLDTLINHLKSEEPTKEQFSQARLTSSVLSSGIRYLAGRNARMGMLIRVASSVLQNKDERLQYLSKTTPELKLLK